MKTDKNVTSLAPLDALTFVCVTLLVACGVPLVMHLVDRFLL